MIGLQELKQYSKRPIELSSKNNLLQLWQHVVNLEGWSLLEDEDLLCLKSPSTFAGFNFSWGLRTQKDLRRAQSFFGEHIFGFLQDPTKTTANPFFDNFLDPADEIEMSLSLVDYQASSPPSFLRIEEIKGRSDLETFAKVFSRNFPVSAEEILKVILPINELSHFFMAYIDGAPVATTQLYIDKTGCAGIYYSGVHEVYRRKGIGRALTHAALHKAKSFHAETACLYASDLGEKLFSRMGFGVVKRWNCRISKS